MKKSFENMKALSYTNLIKLAENRGDEELARELRADRDAERYYEEYYRAGAREEKIVLN